MHMNKLNGPIEDIDATLAVSDDPDDPDAEFETIIRYGDKTQVSGALVQEFLADSSIQGFKYFFERKRHWSERIFWMIMFVIATMMSGNLIHDAWIKWNETPVIISFAEKSTSIWSIPFPAITICPQTKALKEKFNFTDAYHIFSGTQNSEEVPVNVTDISSDVLHLAVNEQLSNQMKAMMQLCYKAYASELGLDKDLETDKSIFDILHGIAPNYTSLFKSCVWQNQEQNCTSMFQPILTDEGVCYTFNAFNSREIYTEEMAPELMTVTENLNAKHWNLADGYNSNDGNITDSYPRRVFGTGAGTAISVILVDSEKDMDYICLGPIQGFKITLHNPSEIPQPAKNFILAPLNMDLFVKVKPDMIITADNLRDYTPDQRQCFFSSERKLRFFKVYTQGNCELECLSNFTKAECGCVKYTLPRDKDTPICGTAKINCYNNAKDTLMQTVVTERISGTQTDDTVCNCLPECISISYETEMSQAPYNWIELLSAYKVKNVNGTGKHVASVEIAFREYQFMTLKRSELYGLMDFLANCGGILGLFIGVTALSFVEIFYYCTLRLYWTLKIYRLSKQKRSRTNSATPTNQTSTAYDNGGLTVDPDEMKHRQN